MPWVKLDDRFPSHRKIALLSDRAFRLHVAAICWSAENLTDGRITDRELTLITHIRGVKTTAQQLEEAGLWDRTADGWAIHDYLDYNPSRVQVLAERKKNAERQQKFRRRKNGKPIPPEGSGNPSGNGVSNGVTRPAGKHDGDTTATRRRKKTTGQNNHRSRSTRFVTVLVTTPRPVPAPMYFLKEVHKLLQQATNPPATPTACSRYGTPSPPTPNSSPSPGTSVAPPTGNASGNASNGSASTRSSTTRSATHSSKAPPPASPHGSTAGSTCSKQPRPPTPAPRPAEPSSPSTPTAAPAPTPTSPHTSTSSTNSAPRRTNDPHRSR